MINFSKIQFLMGILVLLVVLAYPQQAIFAFHNEPDGFRGIPWGTNIADLPDMMLDEDGGDSKLFRRQGDGAKIGDVSLESCSYVFYRGRFYGVFIEFSSLQNARAIKETLLRQHGEGHRLRQGRFVEAYQWSGSYVDIWYDFSESSNKGTLTYFYKPIDQQKEANEKEEAREDASGSQKK